VVRDVRRRVPRRESDWLDLDARDAHAGRRRALAHIFRMAKLF
jgi:hypothetical protein